MAKHPRYEPGRVAHRYRTARALLECTRLPGALADLRIELRKGDRSVTTLAEGDTFGELAMQNVFPRLSRSPGSIRTIAPQAVGQDSDEIYGTLLGLDKEQLDDYRQRAII